MLPLRLSRGLNVELSDDGRLSLQDPVYHGCAVFATPSSRRFEFQFTALEPDRWVDKAGSYCIGVMKADEVPFIMPAEGEDAEDARSMAAELTELGALSTGSFRYSAKLFDELAPCIFGGSLHTQHSLVMKWSDGEITYQREETVVSKSLIKPKGKGKGKCKSMSYNESYLHRRKGPEAQAPVVWMFASAGRGASGGIKVQMNRALASNMRSCNDLLADRMKMLFDSPRFTDCVIECAGQCFEAHRAVLCVCSPVFNAAFSGSMKEAHDARYEVRNCDCPRAVQAMLEFMYKGSLPDLNVDTLQALLPLAIFFEMDELRLRVAEELVLSITVKNVRGVVRVLKEFRTKSGVAECYVDLLYMLKADDDLLCEALV